MRKFIKNIFLIIVLIVIVYLVSRYAGIAQREALKLLHISGSSVAGASTKRAEEISGKITSDVNNQLELVKKGVLNLTLGDAINSLSRLQKVQTDFNSIKIYTENKANDMLKSKK